MMKKKTLINWRSLTYKFLNSELKNFDYKKESDKWMSYMLLEFSRFLRAQGYVHLHEEDRGKGIGYLWSENNDDDN